MFYLFIFGNIVTNVLLGFYFEETNKNIATLHWRGRAPHLTSIFAIAIITQESSLVSDQRLCFLLWVVFKCLSEGKVGGMRFPSLTVWSKMVSQMAQKLPKLVQMAQNGQMANKGWGKVERGFHHSQSGPRLSFSSSASTSPFLLDKVVRRFTSSVLTNAKPTAAVCARGSVHLNTDNTYISVN